MRKRRGTPSKQYQRSCGTSQNPPFAPPLHPGLLQRTKCKYKWSFPPAECNLSFRVHPQYGRALIRLSVSLSPCRQHQHRSFTPNRDSQRAAADCGGNYTVKEPRPLISCTGLPGNQTNKAQTTVAPSRRRKRHAGGF